MRKIISVKPYDDYSLICELDGGSVYKYDMSFLLKKTGEMIIPLKDIDYFKKVFIESGTLAWPNGYDIHGNTIERDGQKITSEIAS